MSQMKLLSVSLPSDQKFISHPIKQSQQRDEGEEECKSLFLHCLENWEGLHGDINQSWCSQGAGQQWESLQGFVPSEMNQPLLPYTLPSTSVLKLSGMCLHTSLSS